MEEIIDRIDQNAEKRKFGPNRFRSDALRWIIIGLFLLGLFFKNRHWPGAGLGLLGALLLSLVYGTWQIIEGNMRGNLFKGFFGGLFAVAMIYLIFRLQFYPGSRLLFYAASICCLSMLVYLGVQKRQKEFNNFVLYTFGLCVMVSAVAPSRLYYGLHISQVLNPWDHAHSDYAWDHYSHLLEAEGKLEEALVANERALEIAKNDGWEGEVPQLEAHRQEILRQIK